LAVRGVAFAATLAALAIAAVLLRPFGPSGIGSDTASSVLYFDRIAAGMTLERFLGTTPKPLLTVVYGLAHGMTGDWRTVSQLGILVWVAAIGCTTLLVGRMAGPIAAAFAAAGLLASDQLLLDASLAYAVSWALLAVALAGLAATSVRPRWVIAGIALGIAALARQEAFLLIGAALAAILIAAITQRRSTGRWRMPAESALLLALIALPLSLLHDWRLTGDPLYFLSVPALGADGRQVATVGTAVHRLVVDLSSQPVLVVLAIAGGLVVVHRRAWAPAIGLLVFGPGMAAFFVWVSWRGYVSLDRYLAPMDLAIVVAAAIGSGAIGEAAGRRFARWRTSGAGQPAAIPPHDHPPAFTRGVLAALSVAAAALALATSPVIAPADAALVSRIARDRSVAADWEASLPAVRAAVGANRAMREAVPPADPRSKGLAREAVLVSAGLLPRAAVDLGVQLDRIGRLEWFGATPEALRGADGSLLYVDASLSLDRVDMSWLFASNAGSGLVTLTRLSAIGDRALLLRVGADP
jgi:hypothetical protein